MRGGLEQGGEGGCVRGGMRERVWRGRGGLVGGGGGERGGDRSVVLSLVQAVRLVFKWNEWVC